MPGNFRVGNFVSTCNNECDICQRTSSFPSSVASLSGFLMSTKYFAINYDPNSNKIIPRGTSNNPDPFLYPEAQFKLSSVSGVNINFLKMEKWRIKFDFRFNLNFRVQDTAECL